MHLTNVGHPEDLIEVSTYLSVLLYSTASIQIDWCSPALTRELKFQCQLAKVYHLSLAADANLGQSYQSRPPTSLSSGGVSLCCWPARAIKQVNR